jgi:two-component system CheB/CheR fusion protein
MSSATQTHADSALDADNALDIVVVDDHFDSAEMLALLLADHGHTTRFSTLGSDALRLIDERAPDVLVLDLSLPELDGYELARVVRGRFGERIRLVALTGFNTPEARELAEWAGFDAFVAKPLRIELVESVLRA